MAQNVLEIIIQAKDEASKALGNVKDNIDSVSKSIDESAKKSTNLSNLMKGSFTNANIISAGAVAGLTAEVFLSVKAFMESEKIMAQTEAVIKSTGGVAGMTAESISYMAGKLSRMSGVSDEAIQAGENMLLTFTSIGKEVFPQATSTILDMSVALGTDMSQSAIQVGKALNDPIRGMTALRKVGVAFSEAQTEQIKKMQESGDLMGAQKIILQELQTEFGGSAEMAGKTFAGKLNILKETFENLQETVGEYISKAGIPLVSKFQETLDSIRNVVAGEETLIQFTETLKKEWGFFGEILGNVIQFFGENELALYGLAGALTGMLLISITTATVALLHFMGLSLLTLAPIALLGAGIAVAGKLIYDNWSTIQPMIQKAGETLMAVFNTMMEWINTNVMPILQAIWAEFAKFWIEIEPMWTQTTQNVWSAIKTFFDLLSPALIIFGALFKLSWEAMKIVLVVVWEAIIASVRIAWNVIETFIKVGLALLNGDWKMAWGAIKDAFVTNWNIIYSSLVNIWEKIKSTVASGVNGVIGLINGMIDSLNKLKVGDIGISVSKLNTVSFDTGGFVNKSGLANVHQGEFVLSRDMLAGKQPVPSGVTNNYSQPINLTAVINSGIDALTLGNILGEQMAFARA